MMALKSDGRHCLLVHLKVVVVARQRTAMQKLHVVAPRGWRQQWGTVKNSQTKRAQPFRDV